ncbi:putative bifunctional diguanylate cyclase/phosphodiesterase [Roseibium alexandrii]|uniref:putative bifunctional diguanylate cyclase/phosphodiesterase n=1 Tax=Roseibium alexandrii TaxID=388408 RepID=UPI0037517480
MDNKVSKVYPVQTLRRPGELFEEVEALAGIGYWEWDEIGDNCTYCSEQLARMHGVTVEEFMRRATSMDADLEWVHPDDREHYRTQTSRLSDTKNIVELEYRIIKTGGSEIYVRERGVAVVDADGTHLRSYGFIQDITSLKSAENALRDLHQRQEEILDQRTRALKLSEERYAFAISGASQGVWEWDLNDEHNYLSEQWKLRLGYTEVDLPNAPGLFIKIVHPEDRSNVELAFQAHLKDRAPFDVSLRLLHRSGEEIWVRALGHAVWNDASRATKMGGTISDITEYRKLLDRAQYYAERDQLTGLYNRHYFMRIADDLLYKSSSNCQSCGVAIIDLDDFKQINDCHGHPAGDSALIVLAERLVEYIGDTGIVIRLGGDEFAVVFSTHLSWAETIEYFRSLLEEVSKPIPWEGLMFECSASLGLVKKAQANGSDVNTLLQQADLAVYDAKAAGGNAVRCYSEALLSTAVNRTKILSSARRALTEERFVLCFQPKADLQSQKLAGFEALLRLSNEDGTLVPPSDYAEVFEDSVLACRIGEMVRLRAIEQASSWLKAGHDFGHIAFNMSPPEFQAYQRDAQFVDRLIEAISNAGLKPSHIQVEVTEDVLLTRKRENVSSILRRLRENGIAVALDDFGTGHASLLHLKETEFDLVKLDVSFVRSMLTSDVDMAIVETITKLAAKLGKQIVAEGIETQEQLAALQGLGVAFGQGYLIGHPVPGNAVHFPSGALM